jgi:hypothetical protein
MLSLTDCIAFSGLTCEQLEAVARYRHVPVIIAAEWAETTLEGPDGAEQVEAVLASEVMFATAHRLSCAECWNQALADFHKAHPELV